tara:strand:+ start:99 stop:815 length:717 start_codon:yes stop_codon:yes gene_type:complete
MTVNILSAFSGIGGFELGLEQAIPNSRTLYQIENDPYCQKVLRKHWPEAKLFDDIRDTSPADVPGTTLIAGGFPCQDLSCASSKGAGLSGKKSGLWYELLRLIEGVMPDWVAIENVNARKRWLPYILQDLAALGYDAEWQTIQASQLGARHKRARCFVIAYPNRQGQLPQGGQESQIRRRATHSSQQIELNPWTTEPDVGRVADGVPARMDRLRTLGNAIVPQCAYYVGRRIVELMDD